MKKRFVKENKLIKFIHLCTFILLLIVFFQTGNFALHVRAESADMQTQEKINQNISEQLDALDLEALEKYMSELGALSDSNVKERLLAYVKGGEFDYENFTAELMDVFFRDVAELLPIFACIAAISLLTGLISGLKSGATAKTSAGMIFLIAYIASLIPLLGILTDCFRATFTAVGAMQKQMQIIFPLMLTLMAASGGSVSVAIFKPAVSFFSTTIVSLISTVVFPLTATIVAFSIVGNLAKELRIHKFTGFFKSINKWIIGVSISVFGLFFTLQGITSTNYDGVIRRAAKYAIGNGIPIVGGFLSGGFDLAVAGSILIQNSLGNMSIFLLLGVIFEPLILLIAVNFLLRFTAAVTQPFGEGKISDFLEETAGNLQFCTAGLLFTAFLYFLTIMQMISGVEAFL